MPLSRRCPVCDHVRARPVWHEQNLRYVRCGRCGVVFSDVDAASYAAGGRNAWHEPELRAEVDSFYGLARDAAHRRFLACFPPTGSRRLLDVGCGLGYFVARAAADGWSAHGCDTSAQWVEHAAALIGVPDRIALSGPHAGLFGGGFEMVTIWDVLEHIHDPLPFLCAISDLLAPAGRVFIRTPNLAWVYPTYAVRRRLLSEDVALGPLNHVVYYSARTLRTTLRSVGLEPLQWPVLPPPQVGMGNRDPARIGHRSAVARIKNLHAAGAELLARVSHGHAVLGSDLDVVAGRR